MPMNEDEVPDLNTIFYDKEEKRIVRRTEKKVNTGGKKGVMVNERTIVHGTDKDPRLMARAGVATTLATEDNMDRIMTDLEQSQKKVMHSKENLKKERDESQNLKRKYEDMISEIEDSKAKCQTLQSDKDALVLLVNNIERESKATLGECEKLQERHQFLEAERDSLKSSIEELTREKGILENNVAELELQKIIAEGKSKLYETQVVALENQKDSLEVSLKVAMEQKIDINPLKKHSLALRSKIH